MFEISNIENTIIQGDCVATLKEFPDNSIDTVVTSPPYNKGRYDHHTPHKDDFWHQRNIKYENFKDDLEPAKYIDQQTSVLNECVRAIKETGSIFYNSKSVIADHRLIFPKFVFNFNVRQIIIWDRGGSPQKAPIRFYPSTEYIFWITKTNVQPKFYRRGKFDKEVWRINPKPFLEHPAPFPEELVSQCIISTTDEGDIVLDPFMGSGTTGIVATKLKRKWVGIELIPQYVELANNRIKTTENQGVLF